MPDQSEPRGVDETDPDEAGPDPVARLRYIEQEYLGLPTEWSAEQEAMLPKHLQDWTQFLDGQGVFSPAEEHATTQSGLRLRASLKRAYPQATDEELEQLEATTLF